MTDKNELLIQCFLKENRQDIPDNGFSQHVIEKLPDDAPFKLSRYWTLICWCAGIICLIILYITGNLHFSFKIPSGWLHTLYELQSPFFIEKLLINKLQEAVILWLIALTGIFSYLYRQYKSA